MRKIKKVTKNKIKLKKKITKKIYIKRKYKVKKKEKNIANIDVPIIDISSENNNSKKRKSNKTSKMYFTQDTQDAIVSYNNEENMEKREKIFSDKIYYPFQKLIENIFNTFKFSYFRTSPQNAQKECLTHLVSSIHKFDPNRRSKKNPRKKAKAYSYFSHMAKNYFILHNNNNWRDFNKNKEIGDEKDENTVQLQQEDKYYAQQEMRDFIRLIVSFWDKNLTKIFNKPRDIKIADAVITLFRNSDRIDAFNKKAIYLNIREISMCKTQQITKVINKMRQYYNNIHKSYIDDGDVNMDRYNI